MEFDFYDLKSDIFALQYEIKNSVNVLKIVRNEFTEYYRVKYVDLVFELYHNAYEFSNKIDDAFDEDNDEQMDSLLGYFKSFIVSYSRLMQYFDFADIDCPLEIWKEFNTWKNKRLELIDYLNEK